MGGDVRYIIALDYEHHIFISEWAKEYPAAKIIGPEGLPEKRAKQDDPKIGKEEFAVVFTKANKGAIHISEEFDTDFEYEYVEAHANLEIVFFYKPDRVLIEADLLFNLPATEQYSKVPEAEKPADGFIGRLFSGLQDAQGDARWIKRFNWYTVKNRESFNESIQRIDKWDFVSLIPCHGDVMEEDAKATFRKTNKPRVYFPLQAIIGGIRSSESEWLTRYVSLISSLMFCHAVAGSLPAGPCAPPLGSYLIGRHPLDVDVGAGGATPATTITIATLAELSREFSFSPKSPSRPRMT
ncbi:hypothetical protein AUP68_05799 [Ilyonectria robusta]